MTESMYYALLALRSPIRAEDILGEIRRVSRGRLAMGPGTLLSVLTRMEKQRFIMLEAGAVGRPLYRITAEGLSALKAEYALLTAMVEDGREYSERWPG